MIATEGEPYLQTLENEISLIELWNLDIAALLLASVLFGAVIVRALVKAMLWVATFGTLHLKGKRKIN